MIKSLFASALFFVSISGYADAVPAKDQPGQSGAGLGRQGNAYSPYGGGMGNPWGVGSFGELPQLGVNEDRHVYTMGKSCEVTSIKSRVQDGKVEFRVCERSKDNKCRVIATNMDPHILRSVAGVHQTLDFISAYHSSRANRKAVVSPETNATGLLLQLAYGKNVSERKKCFDQEVAILEKRMTSFGSDEVQKQKDMRDDKKADRKNEAQGKH